MKQIVKISLAAAVVVGATLVATGSATAGITNTKHNLGSSGANTNNNRTASTGEICVFCHTPHGADIGTPGNRRAVPLWNKRLTTATFTTYDALGTSTLDAGVTSVGSVSLACLTCHDGTQAIDNILNAPGSGGYDATGGGANGLGYTWTSPSGSGSVNAAGIFNATAIVNIGTDLRNDHPVGVQYGGGPTGTPGGPTRDGDFRPLSQIGSTSRWYVDNLVSGTTGAFDKWDYKLYTRTVSGGLFTGSPEPLVECGSCHDPHLETTTFLRIDNSGGGESNDGSRVCLACHTK